MPKKNKTSKNIPWPTNNPKYAGFNTTKRAVHRNGRKRPVIVATKT